MLRNINNKDRNELRSTNSSPFIRESFFAGSRDVARYLPADAVNCVITIARRDCSTAIMNVWIAIIKRVPIESENNENAFRSHAFASRHYQLYNAGL